MSAAESRKTLAAPLTRRTWTQTRGMVRRTITANDRRSTGAVNEMMIARRPAVPSGNSPFRRSCVSQPECAAPTPAAEATPSVESARIDPESWRVPRSRTRSNTSPRRPFWILHRSLKLSVVPTKSKTDARMRLPIPIATSIVGDAMIGVASDSSTDEAPKAESRLANPSPVAIATPPCVRSIAKTRHRPNLSESPIAHHASPSPLGMVLLMACTPSLRDNRRDISYPPDANRIDVPPPTLPHGVDRGTRGHRRSVPPPE